jgi:hypothetical protein
MQKEILISIHISKTGGCTFAGILKQVYGDKFLELSYPHSARGAWGLVQDLDLQKLDCIHGHFSYGIHRYFPKDITCKYVTFLREPIDRLMALYYFNRNILTGDLLPRDSFGTTDEFIKLVLMHSYASLDNGMTRVIGGLSEVFVDDIKSFVTEADYKIALENLSTFYFVGLVENPELGKTEYFKNSVVALANKLNWDSIPEQEMIHHFPGILNPKDLQPMDRKRIDGSQLYDMSLWEEAKKINKGMLNE